MIKVSAFAFCLAAVSCVFGGVEEGLKQLSMHDRACMKAFFDDAIKMDQIAHVLYFENKPVSIIAKVLKERHFHDVLCLKGWLAFKRNEHLFPHPRFIFSESIVTFDDDFKALHIYLINRRALEICLDRHVSVFKEMLGQQFDPQVFIQALEGGHPLDALIQKNDLLLGILLGFGEESSKAFRNFNEGSFQGSYGNIEVRSPKGCKIQPVAFMGVPHSQEVKELVTLYEEELEEFAKFYAERKDLLKVVLERLCGEGR